MSRDPISQLQLDIVTGLRSFLTTSPVSVREVSDLTWTGEAPDPCPLPAVIVSTEGRTDPEDSDIGQWFVSVNIGVFSDTTKDQSPEAHYTLRNEVFQYLRDSEEITCEKQAISIDEIPGEVHTSNVSLDIVVFG